jgi:hypothetical protein
MRWKRNAETISKSAPGKNYAERAATVRVAPLFSALIIASNGLINGIDARNSARRKAESRRNSLALRLCLKA